MLERLHGSRRLRVLGRARGAIHLDLDGFVVTVSARGVPIMPNAVATPAALVPDAVVWDPDAPPAWDPVPAAMAGGPDAVDRLAAWLADRVSVPEVALPGAAARLLGRGPGLTPEGDDVLAGAAIGLRALGPAAGASPDAIDALVGRLVPRDLDRRTGTLSATLLRLAAAGAAPEPVHRLLGPGDRAVALADLRRLGATTGGAIAAGIALAARYLVLSA